MSTAIIGSDCDFYIQLLKWSENANSLLTQFDDKHKSLKCELSEMSSVVDTKADNDEVTKYYVRRDKLCAVSAFTFVGYAIDPRVLYSFLTIIHIIYIS